MRCIFSNGKFRSSMLVEYYERLRCTRIDMNCRVYRPLCGDSYVDLIKLNSVVTAIQDLSPFKPFDPASIVLDKVAITQVIISRDQPHRMTIIKLSPSIRFHQPKRFSPDEHR